MKNNSSNILYIINTPEIDEKAITAAIMYAKSANSHIYFLRIYDSYKSMSSFFHLQINHLRDTLLANLEASVEKFKPLINGLNYSCHVREGIWFIEAIHEAERTKADLTIISEPLEYQATFASNAMHLIRKSATPVWVIRRNFPLGSKKILVTVDIDINDKYKKNINDKCMALANQIVNSTPEPCELSVLHCWSLTNEKYLREIASNISQHHVDEMANRERSFHEEWFNAFCKHHESKNLTHAYFMKGDPEEEIPEFVNDEKVDILIMGTVNSIITSGLYISSRAETILNATSSCSVLTVKPDGFVSPIK